MNASKKIISGLALALALSFAFANVSVAAALIGSDYENGRVAEETVAVRVPAGYHLGVANGSDFENLTMALPEGAKGAELLVIDSFAERGERVAPMIGSDWENLR